MEQVTAWLIGVTLALGAALTLTRARRWANGRPAPVRWVRGLLRLPLVYLVDVHHVVARDAYATRMHVAVAGGFVGAVVLVVLVHLIGLRSEALEWVLLALLLLMLAGALLVAGRRVNRPDRLSRGAFSRQLVLGDNLDLDRIEAAYRDGVLRLVVPVAEKAKPRKIEVRTEGESHAAIQA